MRCVIMHLTNFFFTINHAHIYCVKLHHIYFSTCKKVIKVESRYFSTLDRSQKRQRQQPWIELRTTTAITIYLTPFQWPLQVWKSMFYTVALPQASHSTLCNDHIISSYACIYIIMHISLSRLWSLSFSRNCGRV